jgi:hypothetical protein
VKPGFQVCAAVAVALITVGARLAAIEERPLPAFSVQDGNGQNFSSSQLTAVPQYVLVYVAPGCRPCDRVLDLLKDRQRPEIAQRVVVVVRSDAGTASTYIGRQLADVTSATWYADAQGEAYRSLKLTGWPALVGVRQGRIMWSVSGVLNDASTVGSIVQSWVAY